MTLVYKCSILYTETNNNNRPTGAQEDKMEKTGKTLKMVYAIDSAGIVSHGYSPTFLENDENDDEINVGSQNIIVLAKIKFGGTDFDDRAMETKTQIDKILIGEFAGKQFIY